MTVSSEQSTLKYNKKKEPENLWMIRNCYLYDDEYSDCTSFRSRFQQYFVFGKMEDCSVWQHDYTNCVRWKHNKDAQAAEQVIANEEIRRKTRLEAHYKNPVWENRTEPPADWSAPLPPFLEERQKNTFLELKAQEIREGKTVKPQFSMCTIM